MIGVWTPRRLTCRSRRAIHTQQRLQKQPRYEQARQRKTTGGEHPRIHLLDTNFIFHKKQPHPDGGARLEKQRRPERSAGLVPRGLLHRLDLLLHRLESRSEHGSGQLGNVLAITHRGVDPILDQPLL